MRTPLNTLIVIFFVSVVGLTLVPGVDPEGNPARLSLFESFYFMSYTATTIGFGELIHDMRVAKISVVGVGMRSHAGVASSMFTTLGARGINIQAISTSEIKVSVLIHEDETELAVRVLHTAYGLDAEEAA